MGDGLTGVMDRIREVRIYSVTSSYSNNYNKADLLSNSSRSPIYPLVHPS